MIKQQFTGEFISLSALICQPWGTLLTLLFTTSLD
jgi:hypothetical protein